MLANTGIPGGAVLRALLAMERFDKVVMVALALFPGRRLVQNFATCLKDNIFRGDL